MSTTEELRQAYTLLGADHSCWDHATHDDRHGICTVICSRCGEALQVGGPPHWEASENP